MIPRPVWLLAAGLAFVYLSYQFALIHSPNSNEAWFADAARNLWLHGHMGTTILAGNGTWLEGIDRHTYWAMPLHMLIQSVWYRFFGFSLLSMRMVSVMAGLGMLLAWHFVAGRLTKSWTLAVLFTIAMAADPRLTNLSSNGRMDSLCAFCGVAGLAAYLMLRGKSQRLAILLGHTGVVLGGLSHPCGIIYAFDLLMLQWWFGGFRRIRENLLWAAIPYAVFGTAFGIWAMQDWPSFLRQFSGNISGLAGEYKGAGRFSVFSQSWLGLEAEVQGRYMGGARGRAAQLLTVLFLAGPIWLAVRSKLRLEGRNRLLFAAGVLHFVFFWLFEGLKLTNYLLHLFPVMMLLAMVAARDVADSKPWKIALAMAGVLALDMHALDRNLYHDPTDSHYTQVARILKLVPGKVITAPAEFAFEAGFEGQIQDDHRLGHFTGRKPYLYITNGWQRRWLDEADNADPEIARAIRARLVNEYQEIFRNESFVVWRRME